MSLSKRQKTVALSVGAAGSIGSSVVKTIISFKPQALSILDLNENNLVEVVLSAVL